VFIDRLGQPVVVGSLVFDEQLGCLLVVMRFIAFRETSRCEAFILRVLFTLCILCLTVQCGVVVMHSTRCFDDL